jgi:hypothetical protein
MAEDVHRGHFLLDEVVKLGAVLQAESVEAGTADDLLLEALVQAGTLLPADEHVNAVHAAQRK